MTASETILQRLVDEKGAYLDAFTTLFVHLEVWHPEILMKLMNDDSTQFQKYKVERVKKAMEMACIELN